MKQPSIHYLYKLSASDINYHPFTSISQLSDKHSSFICRSSPISSYLSIISHTIFLYQIYSPTTNHLINMSVCYKPYQFYICLSLSYLLSHIQQFLIWYSLPPTSSYQIHYNHFHYGNRIPSQSSAIPIMHNYSFIDFRNEICLKPFCIIIH